MKKEKILNFLYKYKWFLLVIVIVVGSFYWFQWRPSSIKKDCVLETAKLLKDQRNITIEEYNLLYKVCLNKKGL